MKKKAKKEKILFNQIESFFQSKSNLIVIISLATSFVISMLLFNRDVSVGGDDSGYIKSAYDFVKGTSFPAFHSPFYSVVLSFFVLLFGVKIFLLKFVSILFNLGAIYMLSRFLKKHTNHTVTAFVTITCALNYLLNYYASTTYSESFFLLFQIAFIYFFLEVVHPSENSQRSSKQTIIYFILLGIASYLLFLTKTIALSVLFVSLFYILINKQYLNSIIYFFSATIFHFLLSFFKSAIWKTKNIGFEDQLETILLKSPYQPHLGKDDFMGFVQRFLDNSGLYLSKHFMKMIGIFPSDYSKTNIAITIIVYALLIGSAIYLIIKNKKLLYIVLFVTGLIGVTFVVLQKVWDQERMIMIHFPLMISIFAFGLYQFFDNQKRKNFQFLVILLLGTIVLLNGVRTVGQIQKKLDEKEFQKGDFDSYSPDWQNYMLASKWAGANLPKDAVVLCRKPEMSWIASSGKDIFSGVYRIEYQNADSIISLIKERKATHVILENFRVNPKKKTDKTITTIRNMLIYLTSQNPGCLKFIKEFGGDEKAYIFEINTEIPRNSDEYFVNLESAFIVNPKNVNLYIDKATKLKGQRRFDEALNLYTQGITLAPNEPYLYFNRGLAYFEIGKYKEALDDFTKATSFKDDFNQAWFNRAICLFYLQEYPNARTALEKAKTTGMKNYENFETMLSRYN